MSNRLAFQTQLASIMEVLANAAVAEICKLVDDDYAVVSLQMSQCQRENKALKRKLHLLELKMARGYAERRLRESAQSSRPRVQINTNDRLRQPSPSTGESVAIPESPFSHTGSCGVKFRLSPKLTSWPTCSSLQSRRERPQVTRCVCSDAALASFCLVVVFH